MQYNGKCEYIYKMKPQCFDEIKAESDNLSRLTGSDNSSGYVAGDNATAATHLELFSNGSALQNGTLDMNSGVYACLTYEHRMFITLITNGAESDIIHLIFKNSEEYEQTLALIKDSFGLSISIQDGKLVSYARSISAKLRDGIEIAVFDAQKDDEFVTCPSCGAKNKYDPSMPYCMDCGESL